MSERIHGLAQQLLPEKRSLDEYSLEELHHIGNRYPYFAPMQFLLLEKLRQAGAPEADAQQRKTVLYFPDALLFENFIHPERFVGDEDLHPAPTERITREQTTEERTDSDLQVAPAFYQDNKPAAATESKVYPPAAVLPDEEKSPGAPLQPPPPLIHISAAEENLSEPDRITGHENHPDAEPLILPVHPLPETVPTVSEKSAKVGEILVGESLPLETTPVAEKEEETRVTLSEVTLAENDHAALDKVPKEVTGLTVHPAAEAPAEEPLAFEPYHTVDYFASQGIKVTAEELPKDKLTKQLRSFTDWLKIMKRLPATDIQQTPESPAEKTVETMATHSVTGSEVVTEAMAEVWAKQGNRQKAIETYNKLSLLNPSKKAYFAAKIENLSGT